MEHMGMGRYGKILKTLMSIGDCPLTFQDDLNLWLDWLQVEKHMAILYIFLFLSSEWTLGTHSEIPSGNHTWHGKSPVQFDGFSQRTKPQRISKRHVGCLDATCHTVAIESPWSNSIRLDSLQKGAWIAMLCYAAMPAQLASKIRPRCNPPSLAWSKAQEVGGAPKSGEESVWSPSLHQICSRKVQLISSLFLLR